MFNAIAGKAIPDMFLIYFFLIFYSFIWITKQAENKIMFVTTRAVVYIE